MLTSFSLSKNKPPLCVPSLRTVFPQSSSLNSLNQTIFPNYNDMCRIGFLLFETFLSACLKSFFSWPGNLNSASHSIQKYCEDNAFH